MRLFRWGDKGSERPGILGPDGARYDLTGVVPDIAGSALSPEHLNRLYQLDPDTLPPVSPDARIGPCIGNVGKFTCIGLNYSDHARETGVEPPAEPVVFSKAVSAIAGPNDDLFLPPASQKTDWEVELGVVIGTEAKHVSERQALAHIAGYCVINDYSERAFQLEGTGQWTKGKSYDGFGPIGPWLVTADEVRDPHNLSLWLSVNGHRYQDGATRTMIFSIPFLVSYLSGFMRLEPGDIISTGTPPGVGLGQKPPKYLKHGDVVELEIEGLGRQRQNIIEARS